MKDTHTIDGGTQKMTNPVVGVELLPDVRHFKLYLDDTFRAELRWTHVQSGNFEWQGYDVEIDGKKYARVWKMSFINAVKRAIKTFNVGIAVDIKEITPSTEPGGTK